LAKAAFLQNPKAQGLVDNLLSKVTKHTDIALAVGIIGILLVLLFPVPVLILDVLLAFSITISVIILMTTLFINKPLELNVFPTLLLVTTMLRLSLNIASTRLILSNGHTGTSAAGYVIEAFGGFVMQGNVVIGIIVFIILTIINFMVITKGSGRIAEVAARFSLDAMPGKQMAIDADLSAGLINEEEAKTRRKNLEQESTFYGAMDGANKFVRGDAIAGIMITVINLIGGIVIGMVQKGLSFDNAIQTYTILTIGDGLVSQIPSLVISLAAGLLVSKSGVIGSADKAIFGQLGQYPKSLWLSCGVTGLMAFLPGLPFVPFFLLSVASGLTARSMNTALKEREKEESNTALTGASKGNTAGKIGTEGQAGEADEQISQTLQLDSIRLELGYELLALVNSPLGQKLTDQIKALRKQIIKDLGFVMPSVRIQDNLKLNSNEYVLRIKEIDCGRGVVMVGKLLVMDPKGQDIRIPGVDTTEPTFGLPAKWIDENHREEALFNNYTVVDPATVITTHLTEIIKENITELLSYSETQKLLDEVSDEHKKLVKDVVPDIVTISTLQKVLQNLLSEMISIRDLPLILEATADAVKVSTSLNVITEMVRLRLSRQISNANTSSDGYIAVVTLSQEWEDIINSHLVGDTDDKQLSLPPSKLQEFVARVKKVYDEQAMRGHIPVLLTSGATRPYVRSILERFRASTTVMSQNEIHIKSKIKTLGSV
jgi:flagellar biosynthesis protein FlhA